MTCYRVVFRVHEELDYSFSIPLNTFAEVSKNSKTSNAIHPGNILRQTQSWWVEIDAKDFRTIRFDFGTSAHDERNKLFDSLQSLAFHNQNFKKMFCHREGAQSLNSRWFIYNPKEEFDRMTKPLGKDCQWRLDTEINQNYKLCETYPSAIIVPEEKGVKLDEKMIKKVASYRSKNRLPVLDWIHPETGSALLRCSQPLVGLSETKNEADRKYLKLVRDFGMPRAPKLLIFDMRPKLNAQANLAKGGGYEKPDFYKLDEA